MWTHPDEPLLWSMFKHIILNTYDLNLWTRYMYVYCTVRIYFSINFCRDGKF